MSEPDELFRLPFTDFDRVTSFRLGAQDLFMNVTAVTSEHKAYYAHPNASLSRRYFDAKQTLIPRSDTKVQ